MNTAENVSSEESSQHSEHADASDKDLPERKSNARYVYSKADLLSLREYKESQKEPDESTVFANSKIILKVLKPDCKFVQKLSKSQDHSGIVLGPQKRSWNIGCHVSQPKREHNEVSAVTKNAKTFADRSFARAPDGRRDQKNLERISPTSFRGKDKNYNSQNNYSGFLRSYGKSDNKNRDRTYSIREKEPEWFSEGPETINDTIELVGMNEDTSDVSKNNKPSPTVDSKIPPEPSPSASEEDSAIVSVGIKEPKVKTPPTSSENPTDLDFFKLLDVPNYETGGSHFRHLFNKEDSKKTFDGSGNLNSKLLKLLACSGDQPSPVNASHKLVTSGNQQNSASDLESALRSILLGKQNPGSVLNANIKSTTRSSRNSAPTVEEIEAAALASTNTSQSSENKNIARPLSMQDKQILEFSRNLADPRSWNIKNIHPQVDTRNSTPVQFDRSLHESNVLQPSMLQPPISLSALESMQSREQPTGSKLLGRVTSILQPRTPPGMMGGSSNHSGVPRGWDNTLLSVSSPSGQENLLLNGLLSKMGRTLVQNPSSSSYINSASDLMPSPPAPFSDPAIQSSTRRPIIKSLQSDTDAQMRSSTFHGYARGQPTGLSPGMNPQHLRDFETALFQLNMKRSPSGGGGVGLYQQNQNLGQPTPGSFFLSLNRPMMNPSQPTSNGSNPQLMVRQMAGGGSFGMKPNCSAPGMLSNLQQQSLWLEHHKQPASCSSSDLLRGSPGLRSDELELFAGPKDT